MLYVRYGMAECSLCIHIYVYIHADRGRLLFLRAEIDMIRRGSLSSSVTIAKYSHLEMIFPDISNR